MFRYFKKEIYTYCIMETKKKLTKNQLDALARGRAIRKQNIKTLSKNQTGGGKEFFFEKLDNFWEKADLNNPRSIYYPDTYSTTDWDSMIKWSYNNEYPDVSCPQPWGFIFASYKFLTQDIERVVDLGEEAAMHLGALIEINAPAEFRGEGDVGPTQEETEQLNTAISRYINAYFDSDRRYISRRDYQPNFNTWREEPQGGRIPPAAADVNMLNYFSNNLSIERTKVKHFLVKTFKEIIDTRSRLITQARYGPDDNINNVYRNEEMPMFSDLQLTPIRRAPGGLLSAELIIIWDELCELTIPDWVDHEIVTAMWDPENESEERKIRYRALHSRMIDMFRHIWNRLIVPSMKAVVENSSDPYEEFGIPEGGSVPPAEDTPEIAFRKLPIEIIAAHERKMLEKKYLDKWRGYGITSIDKKYAKTLAEWEKYYIDSYHKGIAPAVWTEPPEPREVTRIKRARERLAKGSLKKRSGAAARSESDYDSDTTSSDDE